MDMNKKQQVVSILMESPLYLTVPLKERQSLLSRLAASYPSVFGEKHAERAEEKAVGYEASWLGIL